MVINVEEPQVFKFSELPNNTYFKFGNEPFLKIPVTEINHTEFDCLNIKTNQLLKFYCNNLCVLDDDQPIHIVRFDSILSGDVFKTQYSNDYFMKTVKSDHINCVKLRTGEVGHRYTDTMVTKQNVMLVRKQ